MWRMQSNPETYRLMADQSDRDLLITLVKDVAEVKTEVRAYRALERDVRDLQKKMWVFMGFAGAIGGTIVSIIQNAIGV